MMCTIKPSLEIAKSPVNVCSPHSGSLFVPIVRKCCFRISSPAIGSNHRAFFYIFRQKIFYRFLVCIRSNSQTDACCLLGILTLLIGILDYFNRPENKCLCRNLGISREKIVLSEELIISLSSAAIHSHEIRLLHMP